MCACIQEDLQWEQRAVAVAVEEKDNKGSIEMLLAGMQIALATMQQADGGHGRNINMVGLVMAMRDQIRLALLTPNNKQQSRSTCTPSYQLPATSFDYRNHEQHQRASFLFIFSLYQLHHCCCDGGPKTPSTAATMLPNAKQVAPAATTTTRQKLLLLEQPAADLLPDDEQEEEEEAGQHVEQDDGPSSQAGAATAGEEKATATAAAAATKDKHSRQTRSCRRLVAAAKCGFSLGLAVLLGLLFSNDHGFWSGLIVATTMTAGRESTWAVAVARAHGTALGSIYGVLGCLLMSQQQLVAMDLRFVALLPWMVLATFLKRSRAYGPAGGVAAALSVVIIMGRRYDEPPMAFTIARLVETFIGISCVVLADLVFQPGARPSVQAREQLARCIAALAACSRLVVAEPAASSELLKRVQQELALLRKHAAEAGSEPTYLWLPPFPAACYETIQGSLGRMAQLLQLYHQARRYMSVSLSQQQVDVDDDINTIQHRRFSNLASTSLGHCLHMLAAAEGKEANKKPKGQVVVDLEAGTAAACGCCYRDDEVVSSFVAQARELLLNDDNDDGDDDSVEQQQEEERFLAVCCLGSIVLCMEEILKEARRLEAHILDLNNNLQLKSALADIL